MFASLLTKAVCHRTLRQLSLFGKCNSPRLAHKINDI